MDDMLAWCDSRSALRTVWQNARAFLRNELELGLKRTCYLNHSGLGVDFLGCRV